jgi:hypothetical protein
VTVVLEAMRAGARGPANFDELVTLGMSMRVLCQIALLMQIKDADEASAVVML